MSIQEQPHQGDECPYLEPLGKSRAKRKRNGEPALTAQTPPKNEPVSKKDKGDRI